LELRKQLEIEKKRLLKELREIQNDGAISEPESDADKLNLMELENINLENPHSPERLYKDTGDKIEEEIKTPEQTTAMILEEEGGQPIERDVLVKPERIMRKRWNEEAKEENKPRSSTANGFISPQRIKGYQTPAKEANILNVNTQSSETKLRKRNKWQQKVGGENDDENDIFNIVKERMPIDILIQICIVNVIEEQNRLVNSIKNKMLIY